MHASKTKTGKSACQKRGMDKHTYDGIATMLGAIVGAGVLGLPFIIAQAGIIPGILLLVGLGIALLLMNLMVGEVVLRTEGAHQLAGYARAYCGRTGFWLMTASMVIGVYGALTAYLIGMGDSLSLLFGGSRLFWVFLSFCIMALVLIQRLKAIEGYERVASTIKIALMASVTVVAFASADFSAARIALPTLSWTAPFGIILFAYLGTAAIPEVREGLGKGTRKLRSILLWSSILPIGLYLLFVLATLGVSGAATSEIATVGLGQALGSRAVLLLNLFALFALSSAFVALGEALKKSYEEDFGWLSINAWTLTVLVPMLLVLVGTQSFVAVLGFTGALAAGLDGIVICWMYAVARKKGTRKPEYSLRLPPAALWILGLLFVLAIAWALTNF